MLDKMENMMGHNIEGTVVHQLNSAVAALGLALQDARTIRNHGREQMIIVARALLLVDEAAADDEALADSEIKKAGITSPTDLIAGREERTGARWMARGGIKTAARIARTKNINEIKDLSAGGLNGIEGAFLIKRKFAKAASYVTVNKLFASGCKSEIRKTLAGEGGLSLDGIRGTYAGTLFQRETVESWIRDAEYQMTEDYQNHQMLRQAAALSLKVAETNSEERQRLMVFHKDQIAQLMKQAAQERAETEAKQNALKLSPGQRRIVEDSRQRGAQTDEKGITDEDF